MNALAGVDGCPAGWLAIRRVDDRLTATVAPSTAELLKQCADCAIVNIDIPIGLPDAGPRACDLAARRLLGAPRSSSVFPCPVRGVLPAASYGEACAAARSADGRGMSKQAFAIVPKIRDVDDALRADASWRGRLFEIHPELSFHRLNVGRSMQHAKRTAAGKAERLALVETHFGDVFGVLRTAVPKRDAADDDILDALAALWTAARILAGTALPAGDVRELDAHGIGMQMTA